MRGVPQGQPQMMQQQQQQQQAGIYGGFNPAAAAAAAYQTVGPTAAAAAYQSVNPAMYATQMQMYGSVAYGGGGGAPQPPPTQQFGVNPYATGQRMANPYASAAAYNSFAVAPAGSPTRSSRGRRSNRSSNKDGRCSKHRACPLPSQAAPPTVGRVLPPTLCTRALRGRGCRAGVMGSSRRRHPRPRSTLKQV
eukprot:TRINITY_DN2271_c0_g1_i2.p3 TRINITY_DN2271_c0_g1~~TRINITY_DN2271_c0_g1_i2.p3  ORF type:complete len:193 (-),score=43.44 TRINITY_DN2271_c0_g1_i2:358-936(-)